MVAGPRSPPRPMARPRVFISSTFYDLRFLRADLERFIKELGYEPVMHERGNVPYSTKQALEHYCYREISQADIVVNIIGGRFGSASFEESYSVSQQELRTAIGLNKQIYVFVEAAVYADYRIFLNNKTVKDIRYNAADDVRILRFIEEVEGLQKNNQVIQFANSDKIVHHLREQWAGLFQRFLDEEMRAPERLLADEMRAALQTLNETVAYLTKERDTQGTAIEEILLSNHPIFARLKEITQTPYPVFFRRKTEMDAWLKARQWKAVDARLRDDQTTLEYMKDYNDESYG